MEKVFYRTRQSNGNFYKVFLHLHKPEKGNGKAFVFLNPFFDEKKRVQKFYATTARELGKIGFTVIRFDYYATGDSSGELFEMDYIHCMDDISNVIDYLVTEQKLSYISFLGIRMGASLACDFAKKDERIKELYLIDPVLEGKKFLLEQRIRRKAFHKLNKMLEVPGTVEINGESYEDHQGFLLSDSLIENINKVNLFHSFLEEKKLNIFSVDFFNRKQLKKIKESFDKDNLVEYIEAECGPFWASLETVNTSSLTKLIIDHVEKF